MKFRTSLVVTAAAALLSSFAGMAAETDAAKPDATAKEAKAEPCKNTGSRINRKDVDKCEKLSASPVRKYSAEEIQMTGEMNLADALRKLDPSFR